MKRRAMPAYGSSVKVRIGLVSALFLTGVIAGVVWWRASSAERVFVPTPRDRSAPHFLEDVETSETAPVASAGSTAGPGGPESSPAPRSVPGEAFEVAWDFADLRAVERAMPDNLVWKLAIPTEDEAILEERARTRRHWEDEYGKIVSNTATREEVDAYYAHQSRMSSDYVQFASFLLEHHVDELRARDVGLLQLARTLHRARLEEIPTRKAEAQARCEAHAQARAAWLAEQDRTVPSSAE